jgi:GT2 family glycosyltransferase
MNSSSPRTLAIIVNWNKSTVLQSMLESLEGAGPREFDAVLVDNASTDNSVAMVREKFPWVHIIENQQNLGGTGGFNCGMRYGLSGSSYDFFWLLDNDVILHQGAYQALLKPMLSDPKVGLVGSTIVFLSNPEQIQESGAYINWETGGIIRNGSGSLDAVPPGTLFPSEFVPACSALARVEAIRQIGIWDENYFLLWDDMDWGVRFCRGGWKVLATRDAIVRHESYDNRRSSSPAAIIYLGWRNSLYTFAKHALPGIRYRLFFNWLRLGLTAADNLQADGNSSHEMAIRSGIADFFNASYGAPPSRFTGLPTQADHAPSVSAPPASIGILLYDNAQNGDKLTRQLQLLYPKAKIQVILVNPTPEMLLHKQDDWEVVHATSLAQRLALALRLAGKYNAVAKAANNPRRLYESLVPALLQFDEDLQTVKVQSGQRGKALLRIAGRPAIAARAAVLAYKAARISPRPADVFDWEK